MLTRLIAILIIFPFAALAQGYAGLGSGDGEGFARPDPDYRFAFPADHGPHPDFRIEWWYLTANLTASDGSAHGLQWTLFRSALAPEVEPRSGWSSPQIWMGHAALTSQDRHLTAERFARGGIGQAGVVADPFSAWIDQWRLEGPSMNDLTLTVTEDEFAYDLRLSTDRTEIFQGEDGYSVKSPTGQASHYYSQPFYEVSGTITRGSDSLTVEGQAWLDREWSSQPLAATQTGWDWFSLHLSSGEKVMLFQLRDRIAEPFYSGTWILPDGTTSPLPSDSISLRPLETTDVADRDVPTGWRVEVPSRDLDIEVRALNPQSWMPMLFSYWEGPIEISGSHDGIGYLEMTGYE